MPLTLRFEKGQPIASAGFMINDALSVYGLTQVGAAERRELDPVLASAEFENVLADVRSFLEGEPALGNLAITELKGVVCHDVNVYRLGIHLAVRENGGRGDMSEAARERFAGLAEKVREKLHLS